MVTFEGLSVDLSASTRTFKRAMETAQEKTQGLNFSLERLEGTADDAEGEIDAAGRSALTTAGMFGVLSAGTRGLSLSMVGLSGSIGTTVASAGALLAVLAPLAATLGVVAAAAGGLALGFGTVLGAPLVTNFKLIKNELEAVREELVTILQPLGDRFLPLLLEGIRAIPDLLRETLRAAGGFEAFAETLRTLGGVAFEVIPGLVAGLLELGRQALPALEDLVAFLEEEGPGAFQEMKESFEEIQPELLEFGDALLDLLPVLLEYGTLLLELIVPAMTALLRFLRPALDLLTEMAPAVRFVGSVINAVAPRIESLLQGVVDAIKFVIDKFEDAIEKAKKLQRLSPDVPNLNPAADEVETLPQAQQEALVQSGLNRTEVIIENINASSRQGGRDAGKGLRDEILSKNVGTGANRGG